MDDQDQAQSPITLLRRYRVLARNTTGALGDVVIVWDPKLKRRLAIKRIPLAEIEGTRALAEARTAGMLTHPAIVPIIDYEVDDTTAYLIMEYVDGATLAEVLQEGPLSADETMYVAEAVGQALTFAHENGVLHLDVKPSNILIDQAGNVRLGDFGMAGLIAQDRLHTARGGTYGYMPPEQLSGEPVTVQSDLYSLGVVLIECLTGETVDTDAPEAAFDNPMFELDLDPQAEEALLTAVDPTPDYRMPSVAHLIEELEISLGSARSGKRLLKERIDELLSDDIDLEDDSLDGVRHPSKLMARLKEVLFRLSAALLCGAFVNLAATPLAQSSGDLIPPLLITIAAAMGAIAPVLGVAIAVLIGVAACVVAGSWVGALVILLTAGLWWFFIAREDSRSAVLMLLTAALGPLSLNPATPLITGAYLTPGRAAVTAGIAGILYSTVNSLAAQGSSHVIPGMLTTFSTWATIGGWMLGASLVSFICSTQGLDQPVRSILAGVAGTMINLMFVFFLARMENDGIWTAPGGWAVVSLLGSLILYSFIVIISWALSRPHDTRFNS